MSTPDADPESGLVSVPLAWTGGERLPVLAANQFLLQVHQDEIFLSVGAVTPPLLAPDEDLEDQLRRLGYVPIQTVGRFVLTKQRLLELRDLINKGLDIYDRQEGQP